MFVDLYAPLPIERVLGQRGTGWAAAAVMGRAAFCALLSQKFSRDRPATQQVMGTGCADCTAACIACMYGCAYRLYCCLYCLHAPLCAGTVRAPFPYVVCSPLAILGCRAAPNKARLLHVLNLNVLASMPICVFVLHVLLCRYWMMRTGPCARTGVRRSFPSSRGV